MVRALARTMARKATFQTIRNVGCVVMKRLKFFTKHADTLKETRKELSRKGIGPQHLHVFIRENVRHRYDGLLMLADKDHEETELSATTIFYCLIFLSGTVLLYLNQLSFLGFAVLFLVLSLVPSVTKYIRGNKANANAKNLKNVYFLVVDVPEEDECTEQELLRDHPDLIPQ